MTAPTLVTRVLPPLPRVWRGKYLVERNVMASKSFWPVLLSGFFEPVFYLFAIGVGIGQLAGDIDVGGTLVPYAAFVAPAMLASSAMNGAIYESTNIFFKLKFGKIYDGVLSTPLRPTDVASGETAWALSRGGAYSVAFFLVMLAMGYIRSPWGVLVIPAALLIGLAFSAVGVAAVTYMRSWQDLDLVTLVTLPLFLFSATFYPLDLYPPVFQAITLLSPLFHGVALCRGLALGVLSWTMLINVAVLVALVLVGWRVASRRIGALLLK